MTAIGTSETTEQVQANAGGDANAGGAGAADANASNGNAKPELTDEYISTIFADETPSAEQLEMLTKAVESLPSSLAEFRQTVYEPGDFSNEQEMINLRVLNDWLDRETDKTRGTKKEIKIISNNRDAEGSMPTGYCLVYTPVTERTGAGKPKDLLAVLCGVVPSYELLSEDGNGKDYIKDAVLSSLVNRLANTARRNVKNIGKSESKLPYTVNEFVTRQRGVESLQTFRKIAPTFVEAMKKRRSMSFMTLDILRLCLSNAAASDAMFGDKMPDQYWQQILDAMIVQAKQNNLDPAIFQTWKDTRTSQVAPEDDETEEDEESLDNVLAGINVQLTAGT